nr:uncharacterized protein LOC111420932 [Onthophagus taurus]
MNMLRNIMHLIPETWSKEFEYENKRYVLVDLDEESEEYKDVEKDFNNTITVTGKLVIQRIQHLINYAKYEWHKLILQHNNQPFTEMFKYERVSEASLNRYLDGSLWTRMPHSTSNNIFIRFLTLQDSYFEKRDSSAYPQYIIKSSP